MEQGKKKRLRLLVFPLLIAAFVFLCYSNPARATITADATLLFSSTATTIPAGTSFVLTARINPGSSTQGINAVELDVSFAPSVLQLTNVSVGGSSPFNYAVTGTTDNANGTLTSAAFMIAGTAGLTSTSDVAYLTFTAVGAGTSPVSFTSSANATSIEDHSNVVATRTGENVTVTSSDTTPPSGGSISYTNGYYTSLSVGITAADGTDSGSGIDTSSRTVKRESATLTAGTCGGYSAFGSITPSGSYPNYTDTTVADGNCYKYEYIVADNAGNTAPYTSVNVAKVDNSAPSGGSINYVNGYYKTLSVGITAADGTDSQSGISTGSRTVQRQTATLSGGTCASFNGWATITPTGAYPNYTDTTVASGNCYNYQYLVSNNAGTQVTYSSGNTVKVDSTAPSSGSISYSGGYLTSGTAALSAVDGTDSGSGIDTSSRTVKRESATLTAGTCGGYSAFASITPTGSYPNYTDTTIASGNCYKYEYIVADNAGNQATYTSGNAIQADSVAPSGGSISYSNTYLNSGTVPLTVSDGTDTQSGISTGSRTVQRQSATLTAGTCGGFSGWSTIPTTGSYPNLKDSAAVSGNCYNYHYQLSDNAGNQATYTSGSTVKIDTVAPTVTQVTPVTHVSSNNVPTYTFNSNEGGTLSLTGGCSSSTTSIAAGTATITLNALARGASYTCTLRVTDAAGNQSSAVNMSAFNVTYQGDFNSDGAVDLTDLSTLATDYGKTSWAGHADDINSDGVVNLSDLSVLATDYGKHFTLAP